MSLGLIYPPSAFCKREELVELAKVLKKYDALLTVHMRNGGAPASSRQWTRCWTSPAALECTCRSPT